MIADCFDKVGKRLPYRVPDTCFEALERNTLQSVQKTVLWRRFSPCKVAAIGAAAMLFVALGLCWLQGCVSEYQIESAFRALNELDQQILVELYEDDVFLNMM